MNTGIDTYDLCLDNEKLFSLATANLAYSSPEISL